MKIIGITGGVGSGKSQVLSYLEERYQARICQADQVAWELQKPGTSCYQRIAEHYGKEIMHLDGTIDRKRLGSIVFADDHEREVLNQIMHPEVKKEIRRQIQKSKEEGVLLFVIEAALLIEEHYDEICDELWFIYTRDEVRRIRLKASRNYEDSKIDAMFAAQLEESVFRKNCQRIIDNSCTFEETCVQLDEAMKG